MKKLHSPVFQLRPSALAVALAFTPAWVLAQTLPTAPSVVQGSANVTRPGAGQMNVQQNSQNVVINWQSFSIGANGRVVFNQPNAQSVALNRVTGSDPSAIFGSLAANGKVFLVNPNGVLFGAGASVNVGGLVASTLNISDSDFAAGRYSFTRGNAAAASVVNEGSLQAAPGGVIALVGSTTSNRGTIDTPQGTAALASGKTVTLDFQGDGLTQLRVTEADLQVLASNTGTLSADGGRVLMLADTTQATGFVVNQGGIVRARSLTQGPGGVLIAGGAGDVSVTGSIDASGGSGQRGADVTISGRNVGLLEAGRIDAGGDQGGGQVQLVASSVAGAGGGVVVARDAQINVDARTLGNGGRVDLTGDYARTTGSVSARGGAQGGNGGLVKLNVRGGVETAGMKVDASAAHGQAGTLNIDPFDVFVYDFPSTGYQPSPLPNPFVPVGDDSIVYTNDINATLNNGTNVTITTGAVGAGQGGTISLGRNLFSSGPSTTLNANIVRSVGTAPVTLRFDAARGIVTAPGTTNTITSTSGPLNVDFNANATGTAGGGIQLQNFVLRSGGGNVRMFGGSDPALPSSSSLAGLSLNNVDIDTRVGQSNANAGGNISLLGQTLGGANSSNVGVYLSNATLSSATGSITIKGSFDPRGLYGSGVSLQNSNLNSTSGAINVTGLGQSFVDAETGSGLEAVGIAIDGSTIQSASGPIDIRGGVLQDGGSGATSSIGVRLGEDAVIRGTAAVSVSGSTDDFGPGVSLAQGSEGGDAIVDGGHVTIVASNGDASTDALVIDGRITSTGITNLRPGAVDSKGAVIGRSDVEINLGSQTGLGLSQNELDNIVAGTTLVLGSNLYGGAITVRAATTVDNNLTLQTGAGGSINLDSRLSVGTSTLALASAGTVTQGGAFFAGEGQFASRERTLEAPLAGPNQSATLTAGRLLVRASSAELDLAGNSVDTLAADTGTGTLLFANNKALVLGPVAAVGVDANNNSALALDASSLTGGAMTVQNFAGNMTLAGNIAASTLDLVTSGTFQNSGNSTITVSNRWHLFADTWAGEARGGLAGNGALPNVYGCSFGVTCAITASETNNTFIYAQRPTLAVTVDNQTRIYGDANPTFTISSNGLLNGDVLANVVGGTPSTTANEGSNVGSYAIAGTALTSPAGYLLAVTSGALAVTPATLTFDANLSTRPQGQANPAFTGVVSGLRNEDSLGSATTGTLTWTSPADTASAPGNYAINGGGLSATNYVFTQGEGNSSALTVTAGGQSRALAVLAHELGAGAIEPRREDQGTYVYDRNLGLPQMCVPDSPLDVDLASRSIADLLAVEWARLRTRPNISNCFDSGRKNACGDF
ncbi:MAG: MBG domain-containing protein [Burkholderiales bacterium]